MMALHALLVVLLWSSLSVGVIVHDNVYCKFNKHEYYVPQGDICKKCDRCPPGFGKEAIKDMNVEIDPVHGALGCRRCVHCPTGYYSKFRTFKECKICRNCALEGKAELRKCTDTSNTKCGGTLPSRQSDTKKVPSRKPKPDSKNPPVEKYKSEKDYMLIIIIVGIITVMALVVLVMMFIIRTRRPCKSSVAEVNDSFRGNLVNETKPILQPDNYNTACEDLDVDGEQQLYPVFKQWKLKNVSEVPLNNQHMLHLRKPLAPNNTFHSLGIRLGIPENEIAIIQSDNIGDIANQAYHTLEKWQRMNGELATVLKVLDCLIELERYDIVERFCKEFP